MGAFAHRRRKAENGADDIVNYAELTVADLDVLLDVRGLVKSGNKSEKVARLVEADAQQAENGADGEPTDEPETDPATESE